PNLVKITADFGSFSIEQGFDGQLAWQKDMHGRVFDLSGFEKTEFMRNVYFMSFAYAIPGLFSGDAELLDSFESDITDVYSVNFYPFLNDTVATVFEFLDSLRIRQFTRLDNLVVITELTDFKNIDSILFPLHTVSVAENTPMLTEIYLESILLDVDLKNSDFNKPDIAVGDFHFPADQSSVTIPFVYSNGHVVVNVQVNGSKKGLFILDTGASATFYDENFVKGLNLSPTGELPSMGLGGFQKMQLASLDSVNIGELTLYSQTAGVLPLQNLSVQIPGKSVFGGLLGYDFFMRFPVMVDFQKLSMTVFNPSNFELPQYGVEHPFQLSMMIPTVTAEIGGHPGLFIVDLGNSTGLIVHQKFGEKLVDLVQTDSGTVNDRELGGVGQGVTGRGLNLTSLQIGAHKINIPDAILAESSFGLTGSWEIAGNIGTKVLEQYRILFDYPHSRIVFYELSK
ncbi:MAG TPA: aspartyl protease family protein, partial [candidate division Zixibacteria bacterium]|nr:aspartyl protease family protein [candidate division Zixibacteria bacterium]